ncbi:MAG: hypothetical protein LYZ69_02255 [Nitrososphaerales archaeon]|nr:hypothetical protein [Nitrososphaerales archaeon]
MAKPPGTKKPLTIALVVFVFCGILLTPAGLENRPVSDVTATGAATLVLFFVGLILAVVSLALLFRGHSRWSTFAIIAAILYFPALLVDEAGLLSTMHPPAVIAFLEVVQALVAVAIIILAARARMEKRVSGPTG